MTDPAIQRTIEKATCSKCLSIDLGTRVRGGFLCQECIRAFIIKKQLWIYPALFREQVIVDEGLRKR